MKVYKSALNLLLDYYWPGNVRQLKNLLQSIVLLNESGVVTPDDLPDNIRKKSLISDDIQVFKKLNVNVVIKLNNRKILLGIAEIIGEPDKFVDITVAIDKLDKIGIEKVNDELLAKGISETAIEKLKPIFDLSGINNDKLESLKNILKDSKIGRDSFWRI